MPLFMDVHTIEGGVSASDVAGADVVLADMRWPGGAIPALRAARGAGKPAIGVGPGNTPAYIEQSADVEHRAGLGLEEDGAPGVRRHRVEVAGAEVEVLALAGGRGVVDLARLETGLDHRRDVDSSGCGCGCR